MRKLSTLYPWQEECRQKWLSHCGRGIVQAVTGSGKTQLALACMDSLERLCASEQIPELRVKIVVPTAALMQQWNRALRSFLDSRSLSASDGRIGLRGAGYRTVPECSYTIYVINSARYSLAREILRDLKNGFSVLMIADECHHYSSGQNQLIFEFLPFLEDMENRFFSLGLTATLPSGSSGKNLTSVLGRCIYRYDMQKAASGKTVCGYDIFNINLSFRPEEAAEHQQLSDRMRRLYSQLAQADPSLRRLNTQELFERLRILASDSDSVVADSASAYMRLAYRRKSLVCMAASRQTCVLQLLQLLPNSQKVLIFGERIRQAEELYQQLKGLYPGKIGRYHSEMGELANRNALNRFRNGELRILIVCKAIDEGVDVPDASIGIILSGTSSRRQQIQRLGRIIRNAEGKERASLYYLHLTDSSEEQLFLPDSGEIHSFELSFHEKDENSGYFLHPEYDLAAENMLEHFSTDSERMFQEMVRCLDCGRVRSDWRLSADILEQKQHNAGSREDRNYWFCMGKLGK